MYLSDRISQITVVAIFVDIMMGLQSCLSRQCGHIAGAKDKDRNYGGKAG